MISDVKQLCITSCNHCFHKECLIKAIYANSNSVKEETHFSCPSCNHPLHLFGLPPKKESIDEKTFDEIANTRLDEDMELFIDTYMETHDMSFLCY